MIDQHAHLDSIERTGSGLTVTVSPNPRIRQDPEKPYEAIRASAMARTCATSGMIGRERSPPGPVAPIRPAVTVRMLASDLQLRACDSRFTVAAVVAGVVNRAKRPIETGHDLWAPIQG